MAKQPHGCLGFRLAQASYGAQDAPCPRGEVGVVPVAAAWLDPLVDAITARAETAGNQAASGVGFTAHRSCLRLPTGEPGPDAGILILTTFEVVRPHAVGLEGGRDHPVSVRPLQP